MSSRPSDHARAHAQMAAYAAGLLDDADAARIAEHVEGCDACRFQLGIDDSGARESGQHIPDQLLARWEETASTLHGLQRELVRQHLTACEECRRILRFTGNEPVLPRVAALEPSPELLVRVRRAAREQDLPEPSPPLPIFRTWSKRQWRIGSVIGAGALAAAATLLLVANPGWIAHRSPTGPRVAIVAPPAPVTVEPKPAPAESSRSTGARLVPPSKGGAPTHAGPTSTGAGSLAGGASPGTHPAGGSAPGLERLRQQLAVGGSTGSSMPHDSAGTGSAQAPTFASLRTETHVVAPTSISQPLAAAQVTRAVSSVGGLRLASDTDSIGPRYAVVFDLTSAAAPPVENRGAKGGVVTTPHPSTSGAVLTSHVVDLWTGQSFEGGSGAVEPERLDVTAGAPMRGLKSALARRAWAGRVLRVEGGEAVVVGEGANPPLPGDAITFYERGTDIVNEHTHRPAGFLTRTLGRGRVMAATPEGRYRITVTQGAGSIRAGTLASRVEAK